MRAHGLQVLLDPHYQPTSAQAAKEFSDQQHWLYAVLLQTVKTITGQRLVHQYHGSGDARGLLQALKLDVQTSTAGILRQRALRLKIETTRLDSRWTKGQVPFLIEFESTVLEYNQNQVDTSTHIFGYNMKHHLMTAVEPAPNLAAIQVRETECMLLQRQRPNSHGINTGYTYEQYFRMCMVAATTHDDKHGTSSRRRAFPAVTDPEVPDDSMEDPEPSPELDVFRATQSSNRPMLPKEFWDRLSNQGKKNWHSFADTDKTVLLPLVERQAQLHHWDTEPTTDVLPPSDTTPDPTPPPPEHQEPDTRSAHRTDTQPSAPQPTTSPPGARLADAHAGDPRRLLSSQNTLKTKPTKAPTRSANTVARVFQASLQDGQESVDRYWMTQSQRDANSSAGSQDFP